jgi:monothiol glutaredoxin
MRIVESMADPNLKDKIEELIRDNQILLFMKGTPDSPACGNSMRAVNVLESYGVEYAALDVLPALQPLREVTGEIADWTTFPQLYVNGRLVGGADIVEGLDESGELAGVLGAERAEPAPQSAKQELQADNQQQSPPIQIER